MKKVFIILFFSTIMTSLVSTQAATICKKDPKKHKRYCKTYDDKKEITLAAQPESTKTHKEFNFFDNVSGSMALTTNYVFRGLSQTANLPAVQGSLTYTFPVGLYLNAWASNVKFTDSTASIEIDTIIGIRRSIGENFTYDINLDRYNYPGASATAYNELNTLFNYRFLQAGISYSSNVYNSHTAGTYFNGGINYQIPQKFAFNLENVTIIALIGRYDLGGAAGNSYTDYNVALNKKLSDIYSIGFQWASTNGQTRNRPYDRDLFIGTISANF